MYREIQWHTGGERGVQGVTAAYSGLTGHCRVYLECVQGLTGGAQGMTGKTQMQFRFKLSKISRIFPGYFSNLFLNKKGGLPLM